MSRPTDLIAQAKAKDPQLGADLDQEFKAQSGRCARLAPNDALAKTLAEEVEVPKMPGLCRCGRLVPIPQRSGH